MVYSTSAIIAGDRFGDPYYFLKRQALYAAIGFVLMILMMFFPYEVLKRFCLPLLILFRSSLDCRIDPRYRVPGRRAMRWLKIQSFSFQPSEFAKLGLIIFLAYLLAKKEEKIRSFSFGFLPPVVLSGLVIALVMKGTRFWSSLFSHGDGFSLSFHQWARVVYIAGAILIAIPVAYFLLMNVGYRYRRLMSFHPALGRPHWHEFPNYSVLPFFLVPEASSDWDWERGGRNSSFFLLPHGLYLFRHRRGVGVWSERWWSCSSSSF